MKVISKYVVIMVLCYMTFSYLGCKKDTIHIDYRRPSQGDTITLRGISGTERGDSALNSVFLDLSKEVQTTVARNSWDFGFYCGKDAFKVIINHSMGATVTEIAGKSLTDVSQADSVTKDGIMTLTETLGNVATVDPVTGDSTTYLAGTIIALNKVYILNRGNTVPGKRDPNKVYTAGTFRPGIKFMITQITNGYHIAYGNLNDPQFNQVDVNKDASFNFKYVSLSSLNVTVEPAKPLWDIEFTRTTYKGIKGSPVPPVAVQPDFVMINFVGDVRAAEVISPTKDGAGDYTRFSKEDVPNIVFSRQRDVIGINWFDVVNSSTAGYSIRTDRFYVIKDPQGNVYKLNFFGGGGRGKPIIRYNNLIDAEPKDPGAGK